MVQLRTKISIMEHKELNIKVGELFEQKLWKRHKQQARDQEGFRCFYVPEPLCECRQNGFDLFSLHSPPVSFLPLPHLTSHPMLSSSQNPTQTERSGGRALALTPISYSLGVSRCVWIRARINSTCARNPPPKDTAWARGINQMISLTAGVSGLKQKSPYSPILQPFSCWGFGMRLTLTTQILARLELKLNVSYRLLAIWMNSVLGLRLIGIYGILEWYTSRLSRPNRLGINC